MFSVHRSLSVFSDIGHVLELHQKFLCALWKTGIGNRNHRIGFLSFTFHRKLNIQSDLVEYSCGNALLVGLALQYFSCSRAADCLPKDPPITRSRTDGHPPSAQGQTRQTDYMLACYVCAWLIRCDSYY